MPLHSDGTEQVYLTGNSLGLQPKSTAAAVTAELQKWAAIGVGGHFTGDLPWAQCEEKLPELLGEVVGAEDAELEVAAMNTLTVNLHMLMAAFYRPSGERSTIIIEAGAFPSDRYAVASQLAHHGVPADRLVEVGAAGEVLATADVIAAIEANHERLALVLLGGVNYLTGQVFDMGAIAAAVHRLNAAAPDRPPVILGYDLAHAVGNVPLRLHEWGVDFAAWCSYKYLNAGAGCIAGMFVHSKHATDFDAHPRLAGWWGVPFGKRFVMAHGFEPAAGAPASPSQRQPAAGRVRARGAARAQARRRRRRVPPQVAPAHRVSRGADRAARALRGRRRPLRRPDRHARRRRRARLPALAPRRRRQQVDARARGSARRTGLHHRRA